MGATRDVALTELPIRGISINDATTGSAAVTVVASDSGVIFWNQYASATTYTLPTAALGKGKWFWFFNQGAGGMVISDGEVDTIVGLNGAAFDTLTFSTGSAMIGAACLAISDGTYWAVIPFAGGTATFGG